MYAYLPVSHQTEAHFFSKSSYFGGLKWLYLEKAYHKM